MSLRLAQIFEVSGYTPKRASLYFKRVGQNISNYFGLNDDPISIDATNFSSIDTRQNKLIISESGTGFTDNGYLETKNFSGSDWSIVQYPIQSDIARKYFLYLRGEPDSSDFSADIYIDGERVDSVSFSGLSSGWQWFQSEFTIADIEKHTLGVQLKDSGNKLDKLYISKDSSSLSGTELATTKNYITVHLQVYNAIADKPTTPLDIYTWKSSINEITIDDWYNFSLDPIDDSISLDFDGYYALVMSTSGGSEDNFIVWESLETDEYQLSPSAIKS